VSTNRSRQGGHSPTTLATVYEFERFRICRNAPAAASVAVIEALDLGFELHVVQAFLAEAEWIEDYSELAERLK
jgi:hypothetical protein